jgi:hypothetical protein
MTVRYLQEHIGYDTAKIVVENKDDRSKDLYMRGIFVQGDVKNANQRVYPVPEIKRAVESINEQIKNEYSILGEADHPTDLKINLDRVSHMITEMWMEGANGYGKLKLLPTPMGNLVRTMIESGVKLGVSSRGTGNVNESNGQVSDFQVVTIDVVACPSAPMAYPTPVYESLLNMRYGHRVLDMSHEATVDKNVQKYLQKEVIKFIKELKI